MSLAWKSQAGSKTPSSTFENLPDCEDHSELKPYRSIALHAKENLHDPLEKECTLASIGCCDCIAQDEYDDDGMVGLHFLYISPPNLSTCYLQHCQSNTCTFSFECCMSTLNKTIKRVDQHEDVINLSS